MTTDELSIALSVSAKRDSKESAFVKSLRRQARRKNPTITSLQSDWLWEVAFQNKWRLGPALEAEAERRHRTFDLRLRVRKTREKANNRKNPFDSVDQVEIKPPPGFTAAAAQAFAQLAKGTQSLAPAIGQLSASLESFAAAVSQAGLTVQLHLPGLEKNEARQETSG